MKRIVALLVFALGAQLQAGWFPGGSSNVDSVARAAAGAAQATADAAVPLSQVSGTGGASKVLRTGTDGSLRLSTTTPVLAAVPAGQLYIDDDKRAWFMNATGNGGGSIWYNTDHDAGGGELQIDSVHRIALCLGVNGALQLGLSTAGSKQYVYLQKRGSATSGTTTTTSLPLYFTSTYWNGSAAATASEPCIMAVPDTSGNTSLNIYNPATQPNGSGGDGSRTVRMSITGSGASVVGGFYASGTITAGGFDFTGANITGLADGDLWGYTKYRTPASALGTYTTGSASQAGTHSSGWVVASGTSAGGQGVVRLVRDFTHNPSTTGSGIAFNTPLALAIAGQFSAADTNGGAIRIWFGAADNDTAAPTAEADPILIGANSSGYGFGIEIARANSVDANCRLFARNGADSTVYSAWLGSSLSAGSFNRLVLTSDGAGAIALYLSNGQPATAPSLTPVLTLSGGPTNNGGGSPASSHVALKVAAVAHSTNAPSASVNGRFFGVRVRVGN